MISRYIAHHYERIYVMYVGRGSKKEKSGLAMRNHMFTHT